VWEFSIFSGTEKLWKTEKKTEWGWWETKPRCEARVEKSWWGGKIEQGPTLAPPEMPTEHQGSKHKWGKLKETPGSQNGKKMGG